MRFQFRGGGHSWTHLNPSAGFWLYVRCTDSAGQDDVRSDAIFEGKVERVELGWKLKEAQIVVRPISYSTFRLKQHFQSAQRCPTLTTPVAGCVQGDIVEREPTVARVHSRRWDEWLFFV